MTQILRERLLVEHTRLLKEELLESALKGDDGFLFPDDEARVCFMSLLEIETFITPFPQGAFSRRIRKPDVPMTNFQNLMLFPLG